MTMPFVHRIIKAAAFTCMIAGLHADDSSFSKYGAEFYRAGVGARAEGLGNANAAVVQDVTSMYWNPAGLACISGFQMHGTHSERFAGAVNVDFIGIALPFLRQSAVGLGFYRLGVDDIPITRLTDPTKPIQYLDDQGRLQTNRPYVDHYVNDQEFTICLTYSVRKGDRFALGVNLKSIHKLLQDYSAWGMGFDFGIQFRPYQNLQIGAILKDATSTFIAWRGGKTEWIRPRLRIGAGVPLTFARFSLLPVLDVEMGFDHLGKTSQLSAGSFDAELHAGLEAQYTNRIAIRIGSNATRFTVGAGFHFSVLFIDYSFSSHLDLGAGHRISATFIWDKNRLFRLWF
jgi:hypothetical protein